MRLTHVSQLPVRQTITIQFLLPENVDGAAISDLIVSEGLAGLQYPASIDHNCVAMTDRQLFQDNSLRIKDSHVMRQEHIRTGG